MTNLDKIIEHLHYHPGTSRRELMVNLGLEIKDTQMKALLANGIARGDIRAEGKARGQGIVRLMWSLKYARLLRTCVCS